MKELLNRLEIEQLSVLYAITLVTVIVISISFCYYITNSINIYQLANNPEALIAYLKVNK